MQDFDEIEFAPLDLELELLDSGGHNKEKQEKWPRVIIETRVKFKIHFNCNSQFSKVGLSLMKPLY